MSGVKVLRSQHFTPSQAVSCIYNGEKSGLARKPAFRRAVPAQAKRAIRRLRAAPDACMPLAQPLLPYARHLRCPAAPVADLEPGPPIRHDRPLLHRRYTSAYPIASPSDAQPRELQAVSGRAKSRPSRRTRSTVRGQALPPHDRRRRGFRRTNGGPGLRDAGATAQQRAGRRHRAAGRTRLRTASGWSRPRSGRSASPRDAGCASARRKSCRSSTSSTARARPAPRNRT